MSDQDPIIITEETEEDTPEPSRFKKALEKVAPYTTYIAFAVAAAGTYLIVKALDNLDEDEEVELDESEVIVLEAEPEA